MKDEIKIIIFFFALFLMSFFTKDAYSLCGCVTDLKDCTLNDTCGAARLGSSGTTGWSCLVYENTCDCDNPGCYDNCAEINHFWSHNMVDSCDVSGYAHCKNYGCPDTEEFNGKQCELITSCWDWVNIVIPMTHCRGIFGRWDASQRRCVACDGKFQGNIYANKTEKFYEVKNYGDCNAFKFTITSDCTYFENKTCESACGAPEECDDKLPGHVFCDGNIKKTCNNNCDVDQVDCSPYVCKDNECKSSCSSDSDCASGNFCCKKTGQCKSNREDCPCDDDSNCPWSDYKCDNTNVTTAKCVNCVTCSGGDKKYCNSGGSKCEDVCGANAGCDEKSPGEIFAGGSCDKNCVWTVNCDSLDKGYPDAAPDHAQKQSPNWYDYNKYSSANQWRNYTNVSKTECKYDVTYDSWIENVYVKWANSGDVNAYQNQNITAVIDIKNVGKLQQQKWFVGVEFQNVSDYNNPWNTRDAKGRVDVYYNGGDKTHGNSQGMSGADCELTDDPNSNGFLDEKETIRVKCSVPASFYPVTTGDKRVMIWIHERDLSQDVTNDGKNTWWDDALARTNKGSGLEDWPAAVRINISPPFPIENWEFPITGVIVNDVITIKWQLIEAIEPGTCGEGTGDRPCHTDVHCFYPGISVPVENDNKWIWQCDPSTSYCKSTEDIPFVQDFYNASFRVTTIGDYSCKIHLRNKGRNLFSDLFTVKVVDRPDYPYCEFLQKPYIQVRGPVTETLTVELKDGKVQKFEPLPDEINPGIRCREGTSPIPARVVNRKASIDCSYPEVETNTTLTAKVYLEYPNFQSCELTIYDLPPYPCEIANFKLKGTVSGTSTVSQNEMIIANITGETGTSCRKAVIKDSAGETKCECSFVDNVCVNSSCFIAPKDFRTYTYTAIADSSSKSTTLIVTYSPGLNMIYENYQNMAITWALLPQVPTKGDKMLLVMNAKIAGDYVTPEMGFQPLYKIIGVDKNFSQFIFLPDAYSNVEVGLWAVDKTTPSADSMRIHIYTEDMSKLMEGLIGLGSIKLTIKESNFDKQTGYLYLTLTSSDTTASITYRIWKASDFSLIGSGSFSKQDSLYYTEVTDIPSDSFFFEMMATSGNKFGGKILSFGLTAPNISLAVSPLSIQASVWPRTIYNATLTLKNTGTTQIRYVSVAPSNEIFNCTTASYSFTSLDAEESKNVSLAFNVSDRNLNGAINIRYSNKTKNVAVVLTIKNSTLVQISPSRITTSVIAGATIDETFGITNTGDIPVTINDITFSGISNLTVDFIGIATIQPGSSKSYKLTGVLYAVGDYSGQIDIETNAGLNSIPVEITVTSVQVVCDNDGRCESGENSVNCPIDCLLNNITSVNSSVKSLKNRMDDLGANVNSTLKNKYNEIVSLLNEARNLYNQDKYTEANQKLSSAYQKYLELEDAISLIEETVGGAGFPTVLVIIIVIAVLAGVIVAAYKFGLLKYIMFWKKEEQYY